MPQKLPAPDGETAFFWSSGKDGRLRILRCQACGHYQHPPLPLCPVCHGDCVEAEPVSGRGRVAAFTVNYQAWLPGLKTPYVFAAVELIEQRGLYLFSNILAPVDSVQTAMPVVVRFEQHDDVFLPMFVPDGNDDA